MKDLLQFCGALLLLLGGCRYAAPAGTASSSFRTIELPSTPPAQGKAKGDIEFVASSEQYREARAVGKPVKPVYPAKALAARAGKVIVGLHVALDPQGRIRDIRPSILTFSTPGPFAEDFRQAAEAALRQWKFEPARIERIETVTENGFTYNRVKGTEYVDAEFDLEFTFMPDASEANR